MQPSPTPRAPLARSTLIKMGVRIAVVIALSTLFSYLHIFQTLRTEALARLEQYASERGQREEAIFVLAENDHALLARALQERLKAPPPEDEPTRFDRLFVRLPDGTVRNRREGFDGTRMIGLFVPRGVEVDAALRHRLLASHDVLAQYGPAFHHRFTNTYITTAEGAVIVYWPERPDWCLEVDPTYSATTYEYYTLSLPEQNPERRTVWSGVYADEVSKYWMVTSTTPLDLEGRQVATFHHDVLLRELMTRTVNEHLPGAYNVLFRDNGELIAHPDLALEAPAGETTGPQPTHLQGLVEQVRRREPEQRVLELPGSGDYLSVARLRGPGWNFATVLPAHVVSQPAFQAARFVLLMGVLSLLLELALMAGVLKSQITRPLLSFTKSADRIASGDFQVELDTRREDELGQLATSFQVMADQVRQREEALRRANEGLEQRVKERTRELEDVHRQLVRTARQAGMAEVATNVLHNVGNVLNSVYTSTQVARERAMELRLEHVSRVAGMLQEHQADLGTFLTQDVRGRNLMPFLEKLGGHLVKERQEIVSLLEDVGRYTEHIGEIIKVQQGYARTPRLHEPVHLAELVEDALRINETALTRHHVKVERHLAPLPPVPTDKHRVLMILVNLVSNAKHALEDTPPERRLLTVTLEQPVPERMRISIQDNGMGIPQEMLTRIFQFGFTTRDEGHGFGLHSSAVAAQELGGSLTAHSPGQGQGATFTLELPCTTGLS
ncbi:MAG TPA: ATP-binding protein [Archangium sp.]|nr:ATP-binding protein [Archangium sp.]